MLNREDVTIGMEVTADKYIPDSYWACGLRHGIIEKFAPIRNNAVIVKFLDHKNRDWIGHSHACELHHLVPFHPNHINRINQSLKLNDSLVALFED